MTKKLTNKQIVGEAMYSVRRSLTVNIPPPPTNQDGSFKSVDQLVSDRRLKTWKQQKAEEREYAAAVAEHERKMMNDPEQREMEESNRNNGDVRSFNPSGLVFLVKLLVVLFILVSMYEFLHNSGVVGCLPGAVYCK